MSSMSESTSSESLTLDERVDLIFRGLESDPKQCIRPEEARAEAKKIMAERDLRIYWGTAPTGRPHIAYFVPMTKIADFLRAGAEVTILFADLHAFLDANKEKATWELLDARTCYYEFAIRQMLTSIGVPLEKLRFVRGRNFQLTPDYTVDAYKLMSLTTVRNGVHAGADVVKQAATSDKSATEEVEAEVAELRGEVKKLRGQQSGLLSGVVYPLLQALDEEYLQCDAQFGGVDQRKIFVYAEQFLPKLGYKKRFHLMNSMVPGLQGAKMSASNVNGKIDLLDTHKQLKTKIGKAFCAPQVIEGNGVAALAKHVLFPAAFGAGMTINRPEKYGGDVHYATFDDLAAAYEAGDLTPQDLKSGVIAEFERLLAPIRAAYENDKEIQEMCNKAYGGGKKTSAAAAAAAKAGSLPVNVSRLDLRVGEVTEVREHPRMDNLFVLSLACGGDEPVQVVCGLRRFMSAAELLNKKVVVLLNMKPSNFRGERSFGMLLAASAEDTAAPLRVPDEVAVGTRVEVDTLDLLPEPVPRATEKLIKKLLPTLRTDEDGNVVAMQDDQALALKVAGHHVTASLTGAQVA
ncbi:MAG: hypothetical protein MHM6MM_003914 [Cercozoa sp. M6MM]